MAGNASWLLAGQLFSKIASFVFFVVVARALGTEEYGYFNFALAFAPLFLTLATIGLDAALVRGLAIDHSRLSPLFSSALLVRAGLSFLALGIALALSPLFLDGREAFLTLALVGFALLIDEISSLVSAVYKAFEQMRFYALIVVVNRIVSTGLALLALALGGGLIFVCLTYALGSLAALAFGWIMMRRRFPPTKLRDANLPLIRSLVKEGTTLGVAYMLNMALFRVDTVMLAAILGTTAVAFYGVAYRFFESFLFVAWSFANIALPRVARSGKGAESSHTYGLSLALALAFYLPVAVGAPFVAEYVVSAIFGERYRVAAEAVPWLSAAGVFYAIAHISRVALVGLAQRKAIIQTAAIALGSNVAINLYLIPRYGFVGAAMATLIAEVIEAALLATKLRRVNPAPVDGKLLAVPMAASLLMGGVLLLARLDGAPQLLLGVLVYLAALPVSGRILAPVASQRVWATVTRRDARKAETSA